MAVDHYENFPVASLLLPARLREPVRHIYRFARSADDIADEGKASADTRLEQLAAYRCALQEIGSGTFNLPETDALGAIFAPLARTIHTHQLPLQAFFDLISAFEQDVNTHRYANDAALLDYCSRSANPVGRLMLYLYQAVTPQNMVDSDSICTGLQLTNFWQDVAIDWEKSRVYLPQDKLHRYGVSEKALARRQTGKNWQALMQGQVQQARGLLCAGLPLAHRLPGRIGFELRLVVQGGLRILERLDQLHYDVFNHRPTLQKRDWALLLWRALR
ncbi:squalene synthase HpnC [Paralcaligenes sp. KSB-10]|uniref:squalene synthase HpnC n=1 Tax=Paralcaligenes sp. KSB-10 TaxID=2901142 RepID=UPI001E392285|nr:squalene synthase HpnC [Paralcaligenes sp. KSB-10]UHL65866.1 squalene synthase HpnC [Paralcaligenes sp. KSB-10]